MFKQILHVQWRASAPVVALLSLACFAVPLLSIQGSGGITDPGLRVGRLLELTQAWIPAYPGLAVAVGGIVGILAWTWDHRGNHVYALSLPISRSRYSLLKMGAGGLVLLLPVLALGLGAFTAVQAADIPDTLRAYPVALTVRFLFAAGVIYAMLFALASATLRTVVWIGIVGTLVLLAAGPIVNQFAVGTLPGLDSNAGVQLFDVLTEWPSPFSVLNANWALIDV